jgi:hypothetical protein
VYNRTSPSPFPASHILLRRSAMCAHCHYHFMTFLVAHLKIILLALLLLLLLLLRWRKNERRERETLCGRRKKREIYIKLLSHLTFYLFTASLPRAHLARSLGAPNVVKFSFLSRWPSVNLPSTRESKFLHWEDERKSSCHFSFPHHAAARVF